MKYRPEIDGLRALAVLPVILYHAGFPLFKGGFIGVDVFFVISGYLITTIILDSVRESTFSAMEFYERRARRILPPLFLVLLACIPFSWLFMFPTQTEEFSRSLLAVCFFVSNFFFMRETEYFSTASDEKPLLHTWSLSVEEQYYLMFPLIALLAWRLLKDKVIWVFFLLAVISLIGSEFGARQRPDYNFFFTLSRAWEIMAGSFAAALMAKRKIRSNNHLSLIGLALIIYSVFSFSKETPTPSVYTLTPVAGTVLLILFSNQTTVGKIISLRPITGVGLISYSLYLWHQPIFAFARISIEQLNGSVAMIPLILITFVLAFLSWRFVERPFRDRGRIGSRRFFIILISVLAILIAFGWAGKKTSGFEKLMLEYKYSAENRKTYEAIRDATDYDVYQAMYSQDCRYWVRNSSDLDLQKYATCSTKYGKPLLVLGDSHAMNLYNIIAESGEFKHVIGVSQGGCRPNENKPSCHYDAFESFMGIHSNNIKRIIYHQSGSYFIKDASGKVDSKRAFEGRFSGFDMTSIQLVLNYLEALAAKHKVEVTWIGPFTEYRNRPLTVIGATRAREVNPVSVAIFADLNRVLEDAARRSIHIQFTPFGQIFYEPYYAFDSECFMFRDADHYSRCGERVIAEKSRAALSRQAW